MAQGTRRRWIRAATTGFGMVLCTGLVGCMNWDKPKDTKATKQATPGLPGTQTLPPNNGAAANTRLGQPYSGPGANIQPAGGFASSGANTGRVGTTGFNTNTSAPPQQYGTWPPQPGNPGTLGSPTNPGVSVQPAGGVGGPVGAAPIQNTGGVAQAGYTPPPVNLDNIPLPPAPPATGAAGRNEFASGPVQPPTPLSPLPPVAPPGVGPTYPTKGGF